MASPSGLAPSHILKVTLDYVEPAVWRTFQIPISASLDDLHLVLQIVMGWENEHLYDFRVGKQTYSPPQELFDPLGYQEPVEELDEEEAKQQLADGLKQMLDLIQHPDQQPERQAMLTSLLTGAGGASPLLGAEEEDSGITSVGDVLKRSRSKMTYTYDFGDGWQHSIVVEKARVTTNSEQPAICLDGAGACPPEDCGGPWGYQRILAAVEQPDDPELEDEREWLEGWHENFDPHHFDRKAVNRTLAALVWSLGLGVTMEPVIFQ